jgi:hypothetical protein
MDVHCSRRARMEVPENTQLVCGVNLDIVPVMYIFFDFSLPVSCYTFLQHLR